MIRRFLNKFFSLFDYFKKVEIKGLELGFRPVFKPIFSKTIKGEMDGPEESLPLDFGR